MLMYGLATLPLIKRISGGVTQVWYADDACVENISPSAGETMREGRECSMRGDSAILARMVYNLKRPFLNKFIDKFPGIPMAAPR